MSDKDPPSMIASVYLSRLRDRSMGQMDEIQGLLDMMRGMELIATTMNDNFLALLKKKPQKTREHQKQIVDEAFSILSTGLEKFVDAKKARITKLINYLGILHQDVEEERNQLKTFEKEWEPINRELSVIRMELMNKPNNVNYDDATKDVNHIKNEFMPKALEIAEKLTKLENQMQKRHLQALALLTTMNTSVDTNELYKLLTGEP